MECPLNCPQRTVRYCYLRLTNGAKHQYLEEEAVETGLKPRGHSRVSSAASSKYFPWIILLVLFKNILVSGLFDICTLL